MLKATVSAAVASPALRRSTGFHRQPLLAGIRIKHGPADLLARFVIAAEAFASARGITLHFGTIDELAHVNRLNLDSWRLLNPTFRPENGLVGDDSTFVLLGVDATGRVVTAIAMKVFDWRGTSFKAEGESLRLLYADPARMAPAGAACEVTAPSAPLITGRVGYSGAAWLHPRVRKSDMAALQSRLARAIAVAHHDVDVVFGISSLGLLGKGYAEKGGWPQVEPGVRFTVSDNSAPPEAGMVWVTAGQIVGDLPVRLSMLVAGGQHGMHLGSAEDVRLAGDPDRQNEPSVVDRRPSA